MLTMRCGQSGWAFACWMEQPRASMRRSSRKHFRSSPPVPSPALIELVELSGKPRALAHERRRVEGLPSLLSSSGAGKANA